MTSAAADVSAPVGVIAGGGAMPFAVAESLAARGVAPVLFALKGACDPERVKRFRHRWIAVGQLGRATRLFREEGCRDLIFIGTLMRPALSEVRLDWKTLRLFGNIVRSFRGGDDHLLSGVGRIFEQDGFRMVGVRDVAPDLLMPEGHIGGLAPDGAAVADIARGHGLEHLLRHGILRERLLLGAGVEDLQRSFTVGALAGEAVQAKQAA